MNIAEIQKLQYGPGGDRAGQLNAGQGSTGGSAFSEMLKAKSLAHQGLNFSKHAARRMGERGIAMDNQLLVIWNRQWRERDKKGRRMWL